MTHSGLQFGGDPEYFGLQEHLAVFRMLLQVEYGPQGDGLHGSTGLGVGLIVAKTKTCTFMLGQLENNAGHDENALHGLCLQFVKGSPSYSGGQVHTG